MLPSLRPPGRAVTPNKQRPSLPSLAIPAPPGPAHASAPDLSLPALETLTVHDDQEHTVQEGPRPSQPGRLAINTDLFGAHPDAASAMGQSLSTPLLTIPSARSSSQSFNADLRRVLGTAESESTRSLVSPRSSATAAPGALHEMDEDGWRCAFARGEIQELGKLGEGTGGAVTRCKLQRISTVFALKSIPADPDPAIQRQILRELAINRSVDSPHIAEYYGAYLDEKQGVINIAMEFCEGGSLDSLYKQVKRRGGRTGERVLGRIAHGVLQGLSYLHARKIIHRDIKPSNILLTLDGCVKLCDFGVSGELVNSLAGTFTGTSYYMAPERIQGQPYTVTSDIWSLGLTLMEVATNKFPFMQEDGAQLMPIELLSIIVSAEPPTLLDEPDLGVQWSRAFRHFLKVCLERNRQQRPSPREMLEHPWVVGIIKKKVDMARWIHEVWH